MTLRKITIDNSIKHIPQREQIRDSKPNTTLSIKQNKKFSQSNKLYIKGFISGEGFRIPKRIMNYYFIEKHTDTLIEQTRTRPQETLEFKMIKQMQNFSCNPPIEIVEDGEWLLAVSCSETTNSSFNIIDENNSFSISKTGRSRISNFSIDGIFDKLKNFLKLKFEKDIELHVQEVRKQGIEKNKLQSIFLIGFLYFKRRIIWEIKKS